MLRLRPALWALLCFLVIISLMRPAHAASVSGSITPSSLPSAGGALNVTATAAFSSSSGGSVTAYLYKDGATTGNYTTYVTLTASTNGTTYAGAGHFTIAANPNFAAHVWTVLLSATDSSNRVIANAPASGSCAQSAFSFTGASISPSTLPSTGGTLSVTATVANPSNSNYPSIYAYLYKDGAFSYTTYVALTATVGGGTYTGSFAISGNPTFANHTWRVVVAATDGSSVVQVLDATGSCAQSSFSFTGASISPSTLPSTGGTLNVTATVANPSNSNYPGLYAYLYKDGAFSYTTYVALTAAVGGGTYTGSFAISGDPTFASHKWTVIVAATDGSSVVQALDATGSCAQSSFSFTGASISPSTLPSTGGTLNVTATVANPSGSGYPGLYAYLYKDGAFSYTTYVALTADVGGGTYTGSFAIPANTDADCHTYTVSVTATDAASIKKTISATGSCVIAPGAPLPVPTFTSISPSHCNQNSSSITATLTGTGFTHCSTISFGSHTLAPTFFSTTELVVSIPASLLTTPQVYVVKIVNPTPGGGTSNTKTFTVLAAASSLTLNPTSVIAGASSTGTVTLTAAAPSSETVTLTSGNGAATVSATVTIATGQTTATFTVTTTGVTALTSAVITATVGGVSKTATLTINPIVPMSLTLSPTSVTGGNPSVGTITLNANAPSGGEVVALTSNSTSAAVPASATVPEGTNTITFAVVTSSVTSTQTATITATANGAHPTATLTITPASVPAPTITSFTPASGPVGTVITVTGTHLNGVSAVRFHNANAATFSANGAGTQLTVTVPTGAGTGTITVTTPGGSVKTTTNFTVS